MDKHLKRDEVRLASANPAKSGRASVATPKVQSQQDVTRNGDAVGAQGRREATGHPEAGGEVAAPSIPSTLNMDRHPSPARTGRFEMEERRREHTEASPEVSAGDEDADWVSGEFVGDETPAGPNPTPGMSVVEDVGKAIGVEYQDAEELKGVAKIEERDRHRWELDPASSEDYQERRRDESKG